MQHVLATSAFPTPPASPKPYEYHQCAQNSFFQQQQPAQQQSIRTHQQQRYVPVAPADRIGTYLGNLQLTGIIGTGAYGVVYEAVDVKTRARYAVKALSKLNADGTPLEARQIEYQTREIRLHYSASSHANVVSMHKIIDVYPDCLFVVLEYCAEGDLFYNITECGHFVGKDELARKVFLQILDAVHFLHSKGIYHRDLKPENILVADGGETLKLADFGLATASERSEDYGCGSTFYMSPECLGQNSKRPYYYCAPNDVWSLGVILVNLTCGRNPWKQASVEDSTYRAYARNPRFLKTILPLSDELDDILARIFAINPDQRITLPELRQRILACPRFTVSPQEQQAAAAAQQIYTPPATPNLRQYVYDSSCSDSAVYDDDDEEEDDNDSDVDSQPEQLLFDTVSNHEQQPQPLSPASSFQDDDEDVEVLDVANEDIVDIVDVQIADCPSPAVSDDGESVVSEASLVADDDQFQCLDLPEIMTPPPPLVAVHPSPQFQQQQQQQQQQAQFQQQCLPPVPVYYEAEDAAMLGVDTVAPTAFHHHQQHQQFMQQQHAPVYHFAPVPVHVQVPTQLLTSAPSPPSVPQQQHQLPLPPPPPQQAPISQAQSGSKFFFPGVWDWWTSKNAAVQGHILQPLQQHMNQHYHHHHHQQQQAMHHHHHIAGFHHPMPMFNMQGCY